MKIEMNHIVLFFMLSILISGCKSLNEPEPIPSFIRIDSLVVQSDYNTEGSASHNILDAWVYVENSLIGTFELPALVPYLGEGQSRINVFGGIVNSGMIENRSQYEFYERTSDTLNLVSGETVVYNPTIFYKEADFTINDNFDFFTLFTVSPGTVNWSTTSDLTYVFEGARSMKIDLNEINPEFKMITSSLYLLEANSKAKYIELDYKTTSDFTIGIIPYSGSQMGLDEPVISFRATDEWHKEYISIGGYINALNADAYAIYISASLSTEEDSGTFLFDNFKLIQF